MKQPINEIKRMQQLAGLLTEIKVIYPVTNNLSKLEEIKDQIVKANAGWKGPEYSNPSTLPLVIKCAELVLPIWKRYYPNDESAKLAIEAAKKGGKSAFDAAIKGANVWEKLRHNGDGGSAQFALYTAIDAAYFAANIAGNKLVNYKCGEGYKEAIKATKKYFNLNEIKVNDPSKIPIPDGWVERELDSDYQDFTPEEKEKYENYYEVINVFSAPMEGWDDENDDLIYIKRDSMGKYFITIYYAFGDSEDSEEKFNSYSEVKKFAIDKMNKIKKDWDNH